MEDITKLKNLQGRKMNLERQPLLGHSSDPSDTEPIQPIARPDLRMSPESALVDVQSEEDGSGSAGSKDSNESDRFYNPAQHRDLEHPTSNLDTLIHLLKGNIGTGILAMPDAFKNAGLYVGLFSTMILGAICTHCMHMLVKCSHELCRRKQMPSLSFPEVCSSAFETGPFGLRKYAPLARQIINIFLCITQLGFCCVYFVFVAVNIRDVVAHYFAVDLSIRFYLLVMLIPMITLNLLKNLKYLTPVSLFASVLTVTGLAVTFHYMLQDLPRTSDVHGFSSWATLPLYFGTAIYAFEGIGVVLPLENNMKTPEAFRGPVGVLNTGMVIVTCLYTAVGFFGYLKYGDHVKGSITLNLPPDDLLAQSVRVMMAFAIFLSYGLQFYVPINIVGPWFNSLFRSESQQLSDAGLRIVLVVFTFVLAAIIPNLGPIISLVGAVSSSTLALIFPPLIEIITFWPNKLGHNYWVLWKDIAIMIFGILGFIFGTYTSIAQILDPDI